jgi:4-aminobutyrate aminotransferase
LNGVNGERYLDFSSGIGVVNTGHCHPKVVKAIQDQAAKLIHSCFAVAYYEPNIALAEMLAERFGPSLSSVFFAQSGSEAMEAAIKLAKYVTQKNKIVAFKGGFHGRTLGALSLTTSKMKYRKGYDDLLFNVDFLDYPYLYRSGHEQEWYIDQLTNFFNVADDVAAVVIEPVLGEGGYVPAPFDFLHTLKTICREKDILLIFDEIQSGMGRVGHWGAFQHYRVQPDIITLAKGIGSGMPLSACLSSPEIMSKWTTGAHGGTYGGNPVTCSAGIATVQVIDEVMGNVTPLGQTAINFLSETLANHPNVGEIRGLGLMIGIELVKDKDSREPYPELLSKVIAKCVELNLIVVSCGIEDNVIRLVPPLIIDEPTLFEGLERFVEGLNAVG